MSIPLSLRAQLQVDVLAEGKPARWEQPTSQLLPVLSWDIVKEAGCSDGFLEQVCVIPSGSEGLGSSLRVRHLGGMPALHPCSIPTAGFSVENRSELERCVLRLR